jgi:hypothetical protein
MCTSRHFCWQGLLSLGLMGLSALVVAGCPGIGDILGNRGGSVVGTWNVTGELVGPAVEQGFGPQGGTQLNQVWTIADKGGGKLTLTGPSGSVDGTASGSGAVFETQFTTQIVSAMVGVRVHIEVQPGTQGIIATEEITYIDLNQATGVPVGSTHTESWKIAGSPA